MGGELAGHLRKKAKNKKTQHKPKFDRQELLKDGTTVAIDFACVLSGIVFTAKTAATQKCRPPQSAYHVQEDLETWYRNKGFRKKNIYLIPVFEGRSWIHKEQVARVVRNKKRNKSNTVWERLLQTPYRDINDSICGKRQTALKNLGVVDDDVIANALKWCAKRPKNIRVLFAPYEADAQVSWLKLNGFADYIYTDDGDVYTLGGDNIVFCACNRSKRSGALVRRRRCIDSDVNKLTDEQVTINILDKLYNIKVMFTLHTTHTCSLRYVG